MRWLRASQDPWIPGYLSTLNVRHKSAIIRLLLVAVIAVLLTNNDLEALLMPYTANIDEPHQPPKATTGVLVTNLGTPDAPTAKALRRYLAEFLSDPRVVEVPRLLWKCILHGVILRIRPARSAKLYKSVWTENGSPLMHITQQQTHKLRQRLQQLSADTGQTIHLEMAMRYGTPSIASGLQALRDQGVRRIIVLPLYPQYSGATTGSTFDAISQELRQWRWVPELHFINNYCDFTPYITALSNSVKEHIAQHGMPQKIVFSYHGTPKRYLTNGDPYHCLCHKTTRLVREAVGLSEDDVLTTFQSRFGREEWLKPYTDHTLEELPEKGINNIAIISPAFSADCLETLEELEEENCEIFMEAGGEHYHYIPALNDRDDHIEALYQRLLQDI